MRHRASRRFLGFVCLLTLLTIVLALLGWPPTTRLAGADGTRAMLVGLAVSLLASAAGGLPILRAETRTGAVGIQDVLASLVVRFLLVLGGLLYVLLALPIATTPFVLWVGIAHLAMLPLDVRYALRSPTAAPGRADS